VSSAGGDRVGAVLVHGAAAGTCTGARLVRGGIELLGRAAVAADAVRLVTERHPAVVVVDLDGGPAALGAIGAVTAASPQVPVLALLAAVDHAAVLTAVRAGATSLLAAPGSPAELADAVRRTASGQAVFSPGLADVVLQEFGRPLDPHEGARRLTEREADVLRLVVEGLTARQIAGRLVLSPRTVENHVQNVLRKLRLHSRAALVRYAIENGLA
jgi:DNA-binding NarL/FixJ family response regulator